MIEIAGVISTVFAVVGVVLNNRRMRACFGLWLVSNAVSLGIHIDAGVWSLAARDGIFLVLAGEGWFRWGKTEIENTEYRRQETE